MCLWLFLDLGGSVKTKVAATFRLAIPLNHLYHEVVWVKGVAFEPEVNVEIVIDMEDPVPLFSQLIEQIKQGVSLGDLKPGDPLPSIRQLANDLNLNHKTVAKAYKLLERDSVIQTRGYRGTFIHPEAKANSSVDLKAWALDVLIEAVARLREAGVTDSEIRIAFTDAMNQVKGG